MEKSYEVGIKYNKELEDGTIKVVTELFLIDAISFTDAEFRAHEELKDLIKKGGEVHSMRKKQFTTITEGTDEQIFFEVKTEGIEDGAKVQKGVQLIKGYTIEQAIQEAKIDLEKEYKICKVVTAKESSLQAYYPTPGTNVRENMALLGEGLGIDLNVKRLANNFHKKMEEAGCAIEFVKTEEEEKAPEKQTKRSTTQAKKTETKKTQRVSK